MSTFLGETVIKNHPTYGAYTPTQWALHFISENRDAGADHKQWLLDQIARILNGTPVIVKEAKWSDGKAELRFELGPPSSGYDAWVQSIQMGVDLTEAERVCYKWDTGTVP